MNMLSTLLEKNNTFPLNNEWIDYFMKIANCVSEKSKDSTKVGSIIVSSEKQILSTGFNGFPFSVIENENRLKRPTKLNYVVHAEQNSICLAARHGISVNDGIIFSTLFPCNECSKMIIQAGIRYLVSYDDTLESVSRFNPHISIEMLNEAKINCFLIKKYK